MAKGRIFRFELGRKAELSRGSCRIPRRERHDSEGGMSRREEWVVRQRVAENLTGLVCPSCSRMQQAQSVLKYLSGAIWIYKPFLAVPSHLLDEERQVGNRAVVLLQCVKNQRAVETHLRIS